MPDCQQAKVESLVKYLVLKLITLDNYEQNEYYFL